MRAHPSPIESVAQRFCISMIGEAENSLPSVFVHHAGATHAQRQPLPRTEARRHNASLFVVRNSDLKGPIVVGLGHGSRQERSEHRQALTAEFGIGSNGYMNKSSEKYVQDRPHAQPEAAATRLLEIAKTLRIDEGRMSIGEWNGMFLRGGGTVAEYTAGRDKLVADGIIQIHECGGFIMWKTAPAADERSGTQTIP